MRLLIDINLSDESNEEDVMTFLKAVKHNIARASRYDDQSSTYVYKITRSKREEKNNVETVDTLS